MEHEQAVVPVDVSDPRTGLTIGIVAEGVVLHKTFRSAGLTEPAGDIELRSDDVFPDLVDRGDIPRVTGQRGDIGHPRIHIRRADGMTDALLLVDDEFMRLVIRAAVRTAGVEKELRQVEISLLSGCPIQFTERHLDDLMTGPTLVLAGTEILAKQVGVLGGDIKHRLFARCQIVGNRRLVEMPHVVVLMAQEVDVFPAFFSCPVVRLLGIDGSCGIEVAVGLLRRCDLLDEPVKILLHLRIRLDRQTKRSALQNLVDVGVIEAVAPHLVVFEFLAAKSFGRPHEVLDSTGLLAFSECVGDCHGAIGFDARCPERIVEMNRRERDRLDGGQFVFRLFRSCGVRARESGHENHRHDGYHQCGFLVIAHYRAGYSSLLRVSGKASSPTSHQGRPSAGHRFQRTDGVSRHRFGTGACPGLR